MIMYIMIYCYYVNKPLVCIFLTDTNTVSVHTLYHISNVQKVNVLQILIRSVLTQKNQNVPVVWF